MVCLVTVTVRVVHQLITDSDGNSGSFQRADSFVHVHSIVVISELARYACDFSMQWGKLICQQPPTYDDAYSQRYHSKVPKSFPYSFSSLLSLVHPYLPEYYQAESAKISHSSALYTWNIRRPSFLISSLSLTR